MAGAGRRSGGKRSASGAGNKVSKSPRRLTADEKIYAKVMSNSKFRSDKQRRAELSRLGIKNVGPENLSRIRASVIAKTGRPGSRTTDPALASRQIKAAFRKASGG